MTPARRTESNPKPESLVRLFSAPSTLRVRARLALLAAVVVGAAVAAPVVHAAGRTGVRVWHIHYRSSGGFRRNAYVLLPSWYGPRDHPPLPLVISPHGRGIRARTNARLWSNLPALGSFAVVNPQGQGRQLTLLSWGYTGQIADLARMPSIVTRTLPWLRIDRSRIYAFGTSMGGQETLLLLARYPRLLAGAAAFDSVTDMTRRYWDFSRLGCNSRCRRVWKNPIGQGMQTLARLEIGGSPSRRKRAYRIRSPIEYAWRIAHSGVPLELWWSRSDRVVVDQKRQSERLFRTVLRLNPRAPLEGFVGSWWHSAEMRRLLRPALLDFGLLPPDFYSPLSGIDERPPPTWPDVLRPSP